MYSSLCISLCLVVLAAWVHTNAGSLCSFLQCCFPWVSVVWLCLSVVAVNYNYYFNYSSVIFIIYHSECNLTREGQHVCWRQSPRGISGAGQLVKWTVLDSWRADLHTSYHRTFHSTPSKHQQWLYIITVHSTRICTIQNAEQVKFQL